MDKRILLVLFLLLSTAIVAAYLRGNFSSAKTTGARVSVGGTEFKVEIADTFPKQVLGLSGHAPLAPDEGMLFIFSHSSPQSFWMKDMLFPIDIIWINEGKVIGFAENAPPPVGGSFSSPASFSSPGVADTVLEVASGMTAKNGIKVGDLVVVKQ